MIRPEDVARPGALTVSDLIERADIEAAFDLAIEQAQRVGDWPALPKRPRCCWHQKNITYVVDL